MPSVDLLTLFGELKNARVQAEAQRRKIKPQPHASTTCAALAEIEVATARHPHGGGGAAAGARRMSSHCSEVQFASFCWHIDRGHIDLDRWRKMTCSTVKGA